MRIIDADSLKRNLSKWMKQVDPTHPSEIPPIEDIIVSTIMTIEEEPTVEAIPVAWLTKRYCAAGVFASPSYHKRADIVKQIIRDYKREQEQIGETEC